MPAIVAVAKRMRLSDFVAGFLEWHSSFASGTSLPMTPSLHLETTPRSWSTSTVLEGSIDLKHLSTRKGLYLTIKSLDEFLYDHSKNIKNCKNWPNSGFKADSVTDIEVTTSQGNIVSFLAAQSSIRCQKRPILPKEIIYLRS